MLSPEARGGMRRREFLGVLGGAAAAGLLAAQERVRRIGVLGGLGEDDTEGQVRHAALREALQQLGWTEGRNIQLDYLLPWAYPTAAALRDVA